VVLRYDAGRGEPVVIRKPNGLPEESMFYSRLVTDEKETTRASSRLGIRFLVSVFLGRGRLRYFGMTQNVGTSRLDVSGILFSICMC
jgi:hypothetical protein